MLVIDWIIFCTVLLTLGGVALYFKKYVKDVSSFAVAGRKTRIWLGLSNQFSGGLGLVAIAYVGQQGFCHGAGYIWIALFNSMIGIILFGIFGFGIQRLRASKAMTSGQYIEMRYSRKLRLVVGLVCGIGGVINMAVFPVTGAKFLCWFLGWPSTFFMWGYEFSTIAVMTALMISAAVFFAVACGQVGVIVTDYLQSIIIMAGLFGLFFIIMREVGITNIQTTIQEQIGTGGFNPLNSGKYGWVWLLWVFAAAIWSPFCFGPVISKNASATNPKTVRVMTLLSLIFGQGKNMIMLFLGLGALAVLGHTLPAGFDQQTYNLAATPLYLGQITPPILGGLLLSAFIAAFISTNDSYLLSWSVIWVNDFICPLLPFKLSTKHHLFLLRLVIILIGIFLYFFGVLYTIEDSVLEFLLLTGTMWLGGGIAVVFGLYWKKASTFGAYAAVVVTCILPAVHLILQKTMPSYEIPAKIAGVFTIATAVILLVVISLFSRKKTKFVDYSSDVEASEKKSVNEPVSI